MADAIPDMVPVTANLSREVYDQLVSIAARRGVDANTALMQAIGTEALFADNVGPNDKVLIRKPDNSVLKFNFAK
jgi:hypothetical protein